MSVQLVDKICAEIDSALRDNAVARFAQTLADCESLNPNIASEAHDEVADARIAISDFDEFLNEATMLMVVRNLQPRCWTE